MVAQAMRLGLTNRGDPRFSCKIDPWFLEQMRGIIDMEARIREHGLPQDAENLRMLKAMGFSDARLAALTGKRGKEVAKLRNDLKVHPVYKRIDTCAAEFASPTAYMYSTYETPFVGETALGSAGFGPQKSRHPRRRAQPDRPGHRVRLLLLPRLVRAARGGL